MQSGFPCWNMGARNGRHGVVRSVAQQRLKRNRTIRAAVGFIVAIAAVLAVFLIAPSPAQKKASAATAGTEAAIGNDWTVTVTQSPENPVAVGASVTYTYKLVNKSSELQYFVNASSADKGSAILTDSACPDANMKITNFRDGVIVDKGYVTWRALKRRAGINDYATFSCTTTYTSHEAVQHNITVQKSDSLASASTTYPSASDPYETMVGVTNSMDLASPSESSPTRCSLATPIKSPSR